MHADDRVLPVIVQAPIDVFFSWGMGSLPEGKCWGLCLTQLCAKYRLVSATRSPYHLCSKIKEAASLKVKGLLYSCLLMVHLPSRSRTLNWHLETIYTVVLLKYLLNQLITNTKLLLSIIPTELVYASVCVHTSWQ